MEMYTAYLGVMEEGNFKPIFSTNMEALSLEEAKIAALAVLAGAGHAQGATTVRLQENGGAFVWQHSNA